jgi:hypothetical protein
MTLSDQFVGEVRDDSLGPTIEPRRHTLHERRNLRNFHIFFLSPGRWCEWQHLLSVFGRKLREPLLADGAPISVSSIGDVSDRRCPVELVILPTAESALKPNVDAKLIAAKLR